MSWFNDAAAIEKQYLERAVTKLENDLVQLRQDFERRLEEKDVLISEARRKVAYLETELDQMRMVMMPLTSQAGAAYARARGVQKATSQPNIEGVKPAKPLNTDWQSYLTTHMTEAEEREKNAQAAAKKES